MIPTIPVSLAGASAAKSNRGPVADRLPVLLPLVLLLPGALALILVQSATEGVRQLVLAATLWLLAIVVLAARWRSPIRLGINRLDLALCAFVASIALSWIGARVTFASAEPFVQWLQGLVLYFLLLVIYRGRRDEPSAAWLLLVLPLVLVVRETFFMLGLGWSQAAWPFDPFSFDPNSAATLVVPGLFVCVHFAMAQSGWLGRVAFAALAAACAVMVYRSDSRAVWLGLVLALGLCALTWSRDGRLTGAGWLVGLTLPPSRVAALLVTGTFLGMVLMLATLPAWFDLVADHVGESVGGRLRRWANGIMIAWERVPLGAGAGNWLDIFPSYRGAVAADPGGSLLPFNTMLELLVEGGVVMIVPFAVLVTVALVGGSFRGRALFLKASLFCLLVTAYFHISFTISAVVLTWIILLFLLSSAHDGSRPATAISSRVLAILCVILATANLGYKGLAAHASIRAAVVKSHLEYIGEQPAFAFSRRAQSLPGPLMDYLQDVDYRRETPATFYEGRFATYIFRDVYETIGTREMRRGQCDAAQAWFEAAIERNPTEGGAISGRCACASQRGEWERAAGYCAAAVEHAPFDAGARMQLAAALARTQNPLAALEQLDEAERLAQSRIGDHEFGRSSAGRLSHFLQQRRVIKAHRAEILGALGTRADPGEVRAAIAEIPEVHKSMTLMRGRLYYTSNEGGGYNLWELRTDNARAGMVTNDSLAAFRLSAHSHSREVFFVADRDGDYHYALYGFDPVRQYRRRIAPASADASVAEYAVSPDGRTIVYKAESGRGHRLVRHDLASGEEVDLPRDPGTTRRGARYEKPVWSGDARRIAFVSNRDRVLVHAVGADGIEVFPFDHRVIDLAFDAGGDTLLVLEEAPDETSRLVRLSLVDRSRQVLRTGGRRLRSVTPVDPGRLLVHEFVEDRYLLRMLEETTGAFHDAGPANGVAYAVTADATARRGYYLHSNPDTPLRVVELDLDTLDWRELYRPAPPLMAPPSPVERHVLFGSGVPYYFVDPGSGDSPPVVAWLHGSTSSFSPRWHKYAQYLAAAGIGFAALNFSGSEGQPRAGLSGEALQARQVDEVREMVRAIRADRRFANSSVVALGVSFGTILADRVVSLHPRLFDGVVEYAPLRAPRALATGLPYLSFAGENDAYANLGHLRAGYDGAAPNQSLVIFPGEGHDLRGAAHIAGRLAGTVEFVGRVSGRPVDDDGGNQRGSPAGDR